MNDIDYIVSFLELAIFLSQKGGRSMQQKIEISGVSKIFRKGGKEVTAMQETNLSIEAGRFVSIIGPSGCGKSTLFNIIAGLVPPSTGKVTADGEDIIGKTGHVGYMLQKDMLLPWRSILDNIILGMEIRGVPRKQAVERALPLMDKYGLKGFDKHYPKELSGGMRQRAALLRTLLYDRDIILLDEPFGALDAQTRITMQNWLLQLWADFGKTVLFVTHDIDEAIYLSDDIYVFTARPGRIKAKVTVNMERPRKQDDLTSEAFTELKHHLFDLLSEEIQTAQDHEMIS
jgi:ABC-type nitrate/sulfonate/bicarbonate transport system ATPase subunit